MINYTLHSVLAFLNMKPKQSSLILLLSVIATSSFFSCIVPEANCEQLSTVFVLETSDSSDSDTSSIVQNDAPAPPSPEPAAQKVDPPVSSVAPEPQGRSLDDSSNTRVITDDEPVKPANRPTTRLTDAQVATDRQLALDKAHPKPANNNNHHQTGHNGQHPPSNQHAEHHSHQQHKSETQRDTHTSHNNNHSSHSTSGNHNHVNNQGVGSGHSSNSNHDHHNGNTNHNQNHANNHNTNHNSNHGPTHGTNHNSAAHNDHHKPAGNHQVSPTTHNTETRRLEEETPPAHSQDHQSSPTSRPRSGTGTATRSTNNQPTQTSSSTATGHQRPKHSTGTSSSSNDESTGSSDTSTPKTEERLLISIISENDDFRGPQKQLDGSLSLSSLGVGSGSSLGGNLNQNDEPTYGGSNSNKRKPQITISIQEAKQSGSSGSAGSPAVILRPSENGQSIVISTGSLGGSSTGSIGTSSINGYENNNKPSVLGGLGSLSSSGTRPTLPGSSSYQNNNNEPPYNREPSEGSSVSIPVQIGSSGHNHNHNHNHNSASTTYRPNLINGNSNNEYSSNSNSNSRPTLTPGFIDQPTRLPGLGGLSSSDERPQRPTSLVENQFENQRPSVRPPINRPPLDQNLGQQGGNLGNEGGDLSSSSSGEVVKFPLNEKNCGLVHETRIVGGDEADPADFLWMAAIVRSKPTSGEVRPFCGGSLITRRHILTAAHCLENLAPRDVLVRLGSYDFDDSTASSLSADFAIDQFRVPAQYSKKTHAADIAIMRLKTPLQLTDNYKTVCMPQPRRSYVGALGTVTGYGSQSQTFRKAAPKLRQVTVPIWENRKCSVVYKRNLTESFLCAGFEEGGKDACQGDSGGPLMIEGPNERMMIVGIVSHGIGCGSPGYPGVYTRTTTFLDWIEKNTRE